MKKIFLFVFTLFTANSFSQGYHIVKDLGAWPNNGVSGTNRICLTEYNSKVYFIGTYYVNQNPISSVLFQTDGTIAGTVPVVPSLSVTGTPLNAEGEEFLVANNLMFFMSNSPYNGTNYGTELWATDGTVNGTYMIKDINTSGNGAKHMIGSTGTKIYFTATDGLSEQIWVSDGTATGTIKLTSMAISPSFWGNGHGFSVIGEKLYFHNGGTTVLTNWVTDGTVAGTYTLGTNQKQSYGIHHFVEYNNDVYYFANFGTNNNIEFYKTNGTASGTSLVKDIITGTTGCYPQALFTFNNKIYFIADKTNANYAGLYESDGTANGTVFIDTLPMDRDLSGVHSHAILNNELYIIGGNAVSGTELYKLVNNELILVKDINPGSNDGISNGYYDGLTGSLHVYNNKIYFSANDGLDGYEQLWSSDGSESGTVKITQPGNSQIESAKNMLSSSIGFFFVYRTSATATELFMLDNTPTSISDISKNISFNLYPNPTKDILHIELNTILNDNKTVTIANILGEVVLTETATSNRFSINTNNLISGVYFVTISNKGKQSTKKIIIE
jgi:ELWxxDGT repeat protein